MKYITYKLEDINDDIWDTWETSCKKWSVYPLNSPSWAKALISKDSIGKEIYLLVAKDGNQIVGYLPYRYHIRHYIKLPLFKYCRPWSEKWPQWFLLIPGKSISYYQELINGLYENLPLWDRNVAGYLQHSKDIETAFELFLKSKSYDFTYEIKEQAEIKGFEDFDSYLASIHSKQRQQYRKSVRELIDTGKCKISHYHKFDGNLLTSIKERIMSIYRESWKTESTEEFNSLLFQKGYLYFSKLLDEFSKKGGLHIMILTIGDEDAAFYVGVHQFNKYISLQTAFKDKFKRLGIGQLIQLENYRYTIDGNYITNNTLAAQKYKKRITTHIVSQKMYVINNKTLSGLLLSLMTRIKYIIRRKRNGMLRM